MPRKQSQSKPNEHCGQCKKPCDGDILYCDLCNFWFHSICVNVDKQTFSVIAKMDQLWFCPACLPMGKKLFTLELKFSNLEKTFQTFESSILNKIDQLSAKIDNFGVVADNHIFPKTEHIDVSKLVIDAVKDTLEAEAKKIVVVFENLETDNDENLLEDVKQLAKSARFDTQKIVNVRRSGPIIKSRKDGADLPRIVKVTCISETARNELIRAVAKYADKGRVSPVYARPDRTYQQRQKLRQLHVEIEEKNAKGENYWFIDRNTYQLKRDNQKFLSRV